MPDAPSNDKGKRYLGSGDGSPGFKRAMAESSQIHVLVANDPLIIGCVKAAVGMDIYACTFTMGMVHLDKELEALRALERAHERRKNRNTLYAGCLMLVLAFGALGIAVTMNL